MIDLHGPMTAFNLQQQNSDPTYTLIGEELYAASAYLSREPVMLGSVKGQDFVKLLLLAWIVIGLLIATFSGNLAMQDWLLPQ